MPELERIGAHQDHNVGSGINWDLVFRETSPIQLDRKLARASIEFKNDKPAVVEYPDGTRRQFEYDGSGALSKVIQPSGAVWTRDSAGKWISDKGLTFSGTIEISDNGDYKTTDAAGLIRTYRPDGSRLVADLPVELIKDFLKDSATVAARFKEDVNGMDLNHDGGLDRGELSAVLLSEQSKGVDKLLAGSLLAAYGPISRLHNDPDSVSGISVEDVKRFDELNRFEEPSKYSPFHPGRWGRDERRAIGALAVGGGLFGIVGDISAGIMFRSYRTGPILALGVGAMVGGCLFAHFARGKAEQNVAMMNSHDRIQKMIEGIR